MKFPIALALTFASSLMLLGTQTLAANEKEPKDSERLPSMLTGKKSDDKKAQQPASDKAAKTNTDQAGKKKCGNARGKKKEEC